jgi:hypothetical protein
LSSYCKGVSGRIVVRFVFILAPCKRGERTSFELPRRGGVRAAILQETPDKNLGAESYGKHPAAKALPQE